MNFDVVVETPGPGQQARASRRERNHRMVGMVRVKDRVWYGVWAFAIVINLTGSVRLAAAQDPKPKIAEAAPSVDRASSGDSPDDPGPLATDLSPAITHSNVRKAAKKVADWQLAQTEPVFNQQWTFAALYDGILAASKTTGDPRYRDAVVKMAQGFNWKLQDARFPHADDMALGQAYMDLY